MSTVNFKKPFDNDSYFEEYLKSKELNLKRSDKTVEKPSQITHLWMLIFVLMIGMVSLGIVALIQYRELQEGISQTRGDVAGVRESDETMLNIIAGDGFSIVLSEPTPPSYSVQRLTTQSPFLDGKPSTITEFISNDTDSNTRSGVIIHVIEYDNSLTREAFTQKVLEKKGTEEYAMSLNSVQIPQENNLDSITKKDSSPNEPIIYTAVTSQNYYIIELYNQPSSLNNPEVLRFTDMLLDNLYLN